MAQQEEPLYDFPEPSQASERKLLAPQRGRGSLRSVSVLDRLLLTVPVWLQLSINSATALHILQREPPGTFLVRKSRTSKRNVLCVRLADNSVPSFVQQFGIMEDHSTLSLETSAISFPDLPRLISFYCVSRDVLPFPLELPEAIAKATSHKELESISHMGVEFWSSHLNVRGPREAAKPKNNGEKEKKPDAATASAPAPQTSSNSAAQPVSGADPAPKQPGSNPTLFHEFCPITTRSPRELDCGSGLGALCFINPLFLQSQSTLSRRRMFKHSVKVRVSTEASTSLSPPLAPPPPPPLMPKTKMKCKAKKGAQGTVPASEAQMDPSTEDTHPQSLAQTDDGPSGPCPSAPPLFQRELQEQDQVAGVRGGDAPALLPTVMENLPEDSDYMTPSPLIRSHSPFMSPYLSKSLSPMAPPLVPKVSSSLSPRDSPAGSPSLSPYQSPSLSPKVPRSLSPRDSPSISPSCSPYQSPSASPRVPFSLSPFTSPSFSQLAERACRANTPPSRSDAEEEEGAGTDENEDEETKEEETDQVLLMKALCVNDTESCSSFSSLEDPAETPPDKHLTNV